MEPLVDITIATYNHEKYISQTIDSVLLQKTNFEYRILIGEDFSTDNTRAIVKSYAQKYQDKIVLYLREKNIGLNSSKRNGVLLLEACTAKYIVMLDGDDYWTDPYKLQKQVDFLEANPDYGMVHTDFDWLDENKKLITKNFYRSRNIEIFDGDILYDYEKRGFIRTPTVVLCRNIMKIFFNKYNSKITEWVLGDLPIFLYVAKQSKIGYLEDSTTVYRRLEESVSSSKSIEKKLGFLDGTFDVHFFFIKEFAMGDDTLKERNEEHLMARLPLLYKLKRFQEIKKNKDIYMSVKDKTIKQKVLVFSVVKLPEKNLIILTTNFLIRIIDLIYKIKRKISFIILYV